jgi:hypothetical protein
VARGDTVYGDAKGCLGSVVGLVVILGVIGLLYEYWYVTLPVVGVILSISLWHRWAGGYLRGEEHHGVIRHASEVVWKCSHTHRTAKAAQLCARKEEERRKRAGQARDQYRPAEGPGAL